MEKENFLVTRKANSTPASSVTRKPISKKVNVSISDYEALEFLANRYETTVEDIIHRLLEKHLSI